MRILAIDTALEACSAAVFDTQRGELLARESLPMARGHAEAVMPLIARVMESSGILFVELDRIAVTVGPGSFTGLRVGISAGRGIALAAARPIVGLTTLAAYAAPLIAQDDTMPVVAAIDARHRQVYVQAFGPGGRPVGRPRIAGAEDAVTLARHGPARLVGSGANLIASLWPKDEPPPPSIDASPAPDIGWVARLGAAAAESNTAPKPLYLRAPDAQPQDAARLPRR